MNAVLNDLLRLSFYAGLVVSIVFVVLYAARSSWRESGTGRAIMALMSIIAISYSLGVIALIWPEFFRSDTARWIALAIRLAILVVLINMTVLLLRAQKQDREENPNDRGSRSRPEHSPLDR